MPASPYNAMYANMQHNQKMQGDNADRAKINSNNYITDAQNKRNQQKQNWTQAAGGGNFDFPPRMPGEPKLGWYKPHGFPPQPSGKVEDIDWNNPKLPKEMWHPRGGYMGPSQDTPKPAEGMWHPRGGYMTPPPKEMPPGWHPRGGYMTPPERPVPPPPTPAPPPAREPQIDQRIIDWFYRNTPPGSFRPGGPYSEPGRWPRQPGGYPGYDPYWGRPGPVPMPRQPAPGLDPYWGRPGPVPMPHLDPWGRPSIDPWGRLPNHPFYDPGGGRRTMEGIDPRYYITPAERPSAALRFLFGRR